MAVSLRRCRCTEQSTRDQRAYTPAEHDVARAITVPLPVRAAARGHVGERSTKAQSSSRDFHADAEGISSDAIVQRLLEAIPTPTENGKTKR